MKILLTGADGFLGWHTRVRLGALTGHEVVAVTRENWARLPALARGADAIIHVAGVNRGEPKHVREDNIRLAADVAAAVGDSGTVSRLVFANSIQAGNETPYGDGKAAAADRLAQAAARAGATFADVMLPNVFGEHGAPRYNSFVATFVDAIVNARALQVTDRGIGLLHAQAAAQSLIEALGFDGERRPEATQETVQGVYERLRKFHELYRHGEFPCLDTPFSIDLFNTYRAALFPTHYPIFLQGRADERGRLVETVRSHGGQGQTFVSTTKPGITRGEHFHLSKVERFVVLSGSARISLRRKFSRDVINFDVTGDRPAVVDMPTMWIHNIMNTGDCELTTLFWTDTLFDPEAPDTYWEPVSLYAEDL